MKAILVGVSTKDDLYDIEYSLKELENLAEALNIECVYKI
jgi:50S ribosomal subunit-associated GTPase HflX